MSPSAVSTRIAETEQLKSGTGNDWRNRQRVALNLFSKLKMGKIQKFLW